jgi:hypothetical protein
VRTKQNTVTFPRERTLEHLFTELAAVRALLERLVVQPQPAREWLTIEQAASLLGRSPQAVRFRCRRGLGVKISGKWRISRDQLFSQN